MQRPLLLYFLGSSAILCTTTSAIVNGVFAASLEHAVYDKAFLAYVAVVLTAISSIVLGLLLVSFTTNATRGGQFWRSCRGLAFILLGAILCAALIFVAITLRACDSALFKNSRAIRIPHRTRALYTAWCGADLENRRDIQISLKRSQVSTIQGASYKADREETLNLRPIYHITRAQTPSQCPSEFALRLRTETQRFVAISGQPHPKSAHSATSPTT
ncbi:hypothetical protein RJZ56_005969 [Blastomyces dermatitidis]